MLTKISKQAIILALLTSVGGVAHAASGARACVFDRYSPTAAVPYQYDNILSFGSYSFLRGVQLYVPATKGLTREWLEASVQRAMSDVNQPTALGIGADALSCATNVPRIPHVNASVTSAGNGFWVHLIARDEPSAKALVNWAQDLVGRKGPDYGANYRH
jgi:disulfide oxidoreductase YuzD